jgi:hypothetical protein
MNNIQDVIDQLEKLNAKVDSLTDSLQSEDSMNKRWLRTNEACGYLSISSSQLQVLKNEGVLEAVKIGGTNFYDRQAIDKILTEKFEEVQI